MSEVFNNASGKVEKLEFIAYSDDKFAKPMGLKFSVQYNPSEFSTSYGNNWESAKTEGSTDAVKKFKSMIFPDLTFDFVLDATGASPDSFAKIINKVDIVKEVKKFLTVCYEYNAETHEPHYVKIVYGSLLYKTVLKSCDVKYTLFKSNGTPIRAKISAKFESVDNVLLSEKKLGLNSPDVTHKRVVKDKDTLIAMAEKIYERNDLYQEVAIFNDLNTFRKVKTGSELYFPSLKR